jgi:hypothetical protein
MALEALILQCVPFFRQGDDTENPCQQKRDARDRGVKQKQ